MPASRISYLWKDPAAAGEFASGVSLHSHTNQSKETLDFLANLGNEYHLLRPFIAKAERRCKKRYGLSLNFAAGYWTPPLTPRLAFDLESRQIEKLNLMPLVSITDHDNINAPMLLRTVASARHIPVSVEWTAPFGGDQAFHLGIHNLPSDSGVSWMRTFEEFTASPSEKRLTEILAALHALAQRADRLQPSDVGPLPDRGAEGQGAGESFMHQNGQFIHALELNGLRHWEENRAVKRMAGSVEEGADLRRRPSRHANQMPIST